MTDIVTDMALHQKMSRREQILSSIQDTEEALIAAAGEETKKYLESYLTELQEEIKALGMN